MLGKSFIYPLNDSYHTKLGGYVNIMDSNPNSDEAEMQNRVTVCPEI